MYLVVIQNRAFIISISVEKMVINVLVFVPN